MTRVALGLLALVGGACLSLACSSSVSDININTDAGSGFEPPPRSEAGNDLGDISGSAGTTGEAGTTGAAGTTGVAGTTGAAGSVDAGDASVD